MYLGHIYYILYSCHIYGKIKKHWKWKGSWLFYGASHEKTESRYLADRKERKGEKKDSSSESEEASKSEDEEIEAMFAESSESDREKWGQSIAKRGFHCEQGVKVDTFLFTHPIRVVI